MSSSIEKSPPNGGFTAWSKAVGCFLIYFNTLGLSASFGVYQTHYQLTGLGTPSAIAWIGTIQVFLLFFISILSGPLFDRGYGQYLFYVGCLLIVLGNFMLSLATEYYQIFLSQSVCIGLGSGLVFVPAIAAAANEFTTGWPIANGIASSGSAIGGIVLPIAFRQVEPQVGFAWTNRIFGFIVLTTSICAILMLRPRSKSEDPKDDTSSAETGESKQGSTDSLVKHRRADSPKPAGESTQDDTSSTETEKTKQASIDSLVKHPRTETFVSYLGISAFREPAYTCLCVGLFLVELGYWVPFFYVTPYAQLDLGVGMDYAFYLLAILNAGSFAGRILPALLAQKIPNGSGSALILVAGCTSLAILCLCWIAVFDEVSITIWAVLTGFMCGIAASFPNTVVTSLTSQETGTKAGLLWTIVSFGALFGAPIAGTLVDTETNSYKWGQVFGGVSILVGSLLLCVPAVWLMPKRSEIERREDGI